jgi:transcriptional regulator with XRE-family HTH domain
LTADKNKLEAYFKSLGNLISKFRKEKKYSLEELGFQIGIDRSAMHRIENGKPITVTTIIKLCLALNKKPKDFFTIDFDFKPYELGALIKPKKSSKKKHTLKKS